ncbi:SDR family NAD(P)-dependent oxidoreductase [Sphingomonas gellani]|nr:SDR family oxidoreductase [Sphingomonas gellani]
MAGKVAVVVGGAKGIGFATARALAEDGSYVILTGRRQHEVAGAAESIGSSAHGMVADAASQADLERVVDEARDLHGRIDALVLNAGLSEPATIAEASAEHFDRHFAVNVRSALFGVQAALPVLSDGASVVLIGSIADVMGVTPFSTYAATKAALRSYARSCA